jgi:nucleoside-diphosphate-sugar epimerase
MKTLVVGGTGFLGQHIVTELLGRGHAVTVLARTGTPQPPASVTVHQGDLQSLDQPALDTLLAGHTGVVFAAGASARAPRGVVGPEYFHRANVEATSRLITAARTAGCTQAVVLSSYFAAADRDHPEWRLAATSPYIHSRVEQAAAAHAAAGDELSVAVLELPYVAGATPGRRSALGSMAKLARRRVGPVVFAGGTAVVSAPAVARAVAGALDARADGDFPIGTANLTWEQLVRRLAAAAGHDRIRVWRLGERVTTAACTAAGWVQRLRGLAYGFGPKQTAVLLSNNVFVDPSIAEGLGVGPDDLDAAFRDTALGSPAESLS